MYTEKYSVYFFAVLYCEKRRMKRRLEGKIKDKIHKKIESAYKMIGYAHNRKRLLCIIITI